MPSASPDTEKGQPGIAVAALFGSCPRCDARTLFDGPANLADTCSICGLDYQGLGARRVPAGLLTTLVWAVLVALALGLDEALYPPIWVHAVIWVPVTAIAVIYALRLARAASLFAAYRAKGEA